MTIKILVHNPDTITESIALAKADELGCTIVQHGLTAKWMSGLTLGKDGYLGIVMCSTHDARRESSRYSTMLPSQKRTWMRLRITGQTHQSRMTSTKPESAPFYPSHH